VQQVFGPRLRPLAQIQRRPHPGRSWTVRVSGRRRRLWSVSAVRGLKRSHFCATFEAPECAPGCKRAIDGEAVVATWNDEVAGASIMRCRRSEHMSARRSNRRGNDARGSVDGPAIRRLAPEGCWFESNRGSHRTPPDLRRQVRRGSRFRSLIPRYFKIGIFVPLLGFPQRCRCFAGRATCVLRFHESPTSSTNPEFERRTRNRRPPCPCTCSLSSSSRSRCVAADGGLRSARRRRPGTFGFLGLSAASERRYL
jgi:hypothetical protein